MCKNLARKMSLFLQCIKNLARFFLWFVPFPLQWPISCFANKLLTFSVTSCCTISIHSTFVSVTFYLPVAFSLQATCTHTLTYLTYKSLTCYSRVAHESLTSCSTVAHELLASCLRVACQLLTYNLQALVTLRLSFTVFVKDG